ncbi:MAG: hypothetical protein SGILL_001757 [Bacillariaceae sp.]
MSVEPSSADASISKTTAVTTDTSLASGKQPVADDNDDDDKSLEEAALKGDDEQDSNAAAAGSLGDFDDSMPDFTPPLRIHTIRGTSEQPRLTGSHSQLQGLPNPRELQHNMRRRKNDSSNISSRSGSESPASSRGHKHYDGGSSISSLEDAGIDIDILTDKMGVLELDLKTQQDMSHTLNKSLSNLTAVNERMSDETLEDVHAFSDVKREGTQSRGGSITTGGEVSSNVLEPLEEIEEQEDVDNEGEKVKITNLAEILENPDEEA